MADSFTQSREVFFRKRKQNISPVKPAFKVFNVLLYIHGIQMLCVKQRSFSIIVLLIQTFAMFYFLMCIVECFHYKIDISVVTVICSYAIKQIMVVCTLLVVIIRHGKINSFYQRFITTFGNVPAQMSTCIQRKVGLIMALLIGLVLLLSVSDIMMLIDGLKNEDKLFIYENVYKWPPANASHANILAIILSCNLVTLYTETTFVSMLCFNSYVFLLCSVNYSQITETSTLSQVKLRLNPYRRLKTLNSMVDEFNECFSFLVFLWLGSLLTTALMNLRGIQQMKLELQDVSYFVIEIVKTFFSFFILYLSASKINEKARQAAEIITDINPQQYDMTTNNSNNTLTTDKHPTTTDMQIHNKISSTDVGISVWNFAVVKWSHLLPIAGTMLTYLIILYQTK